MQQNTNSESSDCCIHVHEYIQNINLTIFVLMQDISKYVVRILFLQIFYVKDIRYTLVASFDIM